MQFVSDVADRNGAVKMVENAKENLSEVENILVDAGYTGENFAAQIKEIIGASVEVAKRNELHKFVVLPKRWVAERSFAWLDKCRRLWKSCETNLQMVFWHLLFCCSKDCEQVLSKIPCSQ